MASSAAWLFLSNVVAHHLSWIGLALTLVGLIEKLAGKAIVIPPKWAVRVGVMFLFVSSYQTSLDEHRNLETLIGEKATLSSENWQLKQRNIQLQNGNQDVGERTKITREGLASLIVRGVKIRDRMQMGAVDAPAGILTDLKRWKNDTDRFLRTYLDATDAETFKSYDVPEYPLKIRTMNQIGVLEDIAKQHEH